MRKGALNDMAEQLGCNKIALGHNKDDVVETFFMSLLYEGRLNCFAPVSFLDRKKLYSIPSADVRAGMGMSQLCQ